ncbi:MAG: toll/interleukin-1 receptor domain-containing protein [Thaumarchaeota archaeon]|nr:toll/interleukin-1 receptor domain-containing protein [Nitrososphaerota archaeon]
MSQDNLKKHNSVRSKFKTFVCFSKNDEEKAHILESALAEKGFGTYLVDVESHDSFLSSELKDMIRSSVCFIAILTSKLLVSSLFNQEIGYAQGKGLRVILVVNTSLKNDVQNIKTKLSIIEFNENDFKQSCLLVTDKVSKITEILDEPIDFESFLDFYTESKTKPG